MRPKDERYGGPHVAITLAADLVDQGIRMCTGIPFSDEGQQAFCQMIEVRAIADPQSDAVHNTQPLLDLVHLGAMRRKISDR